MEYRIARNLYKHLSYHIVTNIITCEIRTDLLVHNPSPKIQYGKHLRGMI